MLFRSVLCSGKVYYDLLAARDEMNISNVALIRMEQLYPFPAGPLLAELEAYDHAEFVWCQEEPRNMGGWTFARDFIEDAMQTAGAVQHRVIYAGRDAAASPATGTLGRHKREQDKLVADALGLGG